MIARAGVRAGPSCYVRRVDYRARQQRLRETLASARLDGLLLTHLPNVRYLCGFTGSSGALLATPSSTTFFSDGRYALQARSEVAGARVVISGAALPGAIAKHLASSLRPGGPWVLGIEADFVTLSLRAVLSKQMPSRVRLRSVSGIVEAQRRIKDREEIEALRAAAQLGGEVFSRIIPRVRAGASEAELAAKLEFEARRAGAEAMSFPTIVAAGKRSALPHARPTRAGLPRRGFVVFDFGVILAGYCSDMTRTVHLGRPGERERAIYQAVRQAQAAGVGSVAAGVPARTVDHASRSLLRRSSLARYFTHSTGHGVGLEIHEGPRLARNQAEELRAGMVITVEPGVYIPGSGGVRIEDMVLVTESGHEVLTAATRELITL